MRISIAILVVMAVSWGFLLKAYSKEAKNDGGIQMTKMSIYDFSVVTINGEEKKLSDYMGKALLIVNTASKCGFTPQYAGLEKLYGEYKDKGFEVLAFPANNFLGQEPGTDAEIIDLFFIKSIKVVNIRPFL